MQACVAIPTFRCIINRQDTKLAVIQNILKSVFIVNVGELDELVSFLYENEADYITKDGDKFVFQSPMGMIHAYPKKGCVLVTTAEFDGKLLLHAYVPVSSQIQSCSGRIYDRSEDGDFDITNSTDLVAHLSVRKSNQFTEREIFPYATLDDLRLDLIPRVKKMAAIRENTKFRAAFTKAHN